MRGLKDKRVLITGGARGIGEAIAARFLEEGSCVVILDKDEAGCRDIKQKIPALTGTLVADVSNPIEVKQAFIEMDRMMNGLDILINNAGISMRKPFLEVDPKEWSEVIQVNLNGLFFIAQKAALIMLNGKGGVILNMGSTNGLIGYLQWLI